MTINFRDIGFVINKNRFSNNKLFVDLFTQNSGRVTALTTMTPASNSGGFNYDIFSFFEIEGTGKLDTQGTVRLNFPQLTPLYELNKNTPNYSGFLFFNLWCELLNNTETDGDESLQLYECSENLRKSVHENKNSYFHQVYTLFLYFKICHLLFNFHSCEICGVPAYRLENGKYSYRKAKYIFQNDQSINCDSCAPAPYFMGSSDIKICIILDQLKYNSADYTPEIPQKNLIDFTVCLLNYFKKISGKQLKTESLYVRSLSNL